MPVSNVRRRDFLAGISAIAGLAANTQELFAGEKVFGVRRSRGDIGRSACRSFAFPAVAAASMPEFLLIGNFAQAVRMRGPADLGKALAGTGYVELRRYRFASEHDRVHARQVFVRAGIQPLLVGESGDFLFRFETLTTREKTWREIIAEPQWTGLQGQLGELAIYKVTR